jgi:hypothetical protein
MKLAVAAVLGDTDRLFRWLPFSSASAAVRFDMGGRVDGMRGLTFVHCPSFNQNKFESVDLNMVN